RSQGASASRFTFPCWVLSCCSLCWFSRATQADRERALARQKEIAGGPRTSDIAHMAVSSPVQLRHATDERRASSPSVLGVKVKAAIAQEDRLLLVKGKKRIRSKQVAMSSESLNSGDVFLLETRNKIFHWNGKKSSRPERTKVCVCVCRRRWSVVLTVLAGRG